MSDRLFTQFAPAERAPAAEVAAQAQTFLAASPLLRPILDAIPEILLALNDNRQIVFANRGLLTLLNLSEEAVRGLRVGEALDCAHAADLEGGCATTEFCRTCGAATAFLATLTGQPAMRECQIIRRNGDALDLRVWATPLLLAGQCWTLFALADISDEKRRRALEQIFFHDVLNTATAVSCSADILASSLPQETAGIGASLNNLVGRLIDEIVAQRELTAAENNELLVSVAPVDAELLLHDVAETCMQIPAGKGRQVTVEVPAPGVTLSSDRTILRRVVGNLVKNALEATPPGSTIALRAEQRDGATEFSVHNPGGMPREVQLQVFRRSFSTKGSGRGLGTYGSRLLTERYLKGSLSFTSSEQEGTTFRVRLPLFLPQGSGLRIP